MYWIYDIPNGYGALLFALVFAGFGVIGLVTTRRMIHRWIQREPEWNQVAGYVLNAYVVFFGLLLGFIAVESHEDFQAVDQTISREGSVLEAVYRDLDGLPEPYQGNLKLCLKQYCQNTISVDWPKQRMGIVPEEGTAVLDQFVKILFSFEPKSRSQELVLAETIREFNAYMDLRRQRLHSVRAGLPREMWWTLGVGAVFNIAMTWFFGVKSYSLHMTQVAGLALFIGLLIFLIVALDCPFRGEFSIPPDVYQMLLDGPMKK